MGDDIVKKKMIVLIAFIYIASMLFCGDGVGKKFVEEKFPHLTYSDKECDDSKKKELRIVEDEDTAGGILSYEELAAMENENASVRNNMLPDTDQLAFVDEAEKNGELAELEEQQNVKMPQVDMSFDNLVKNYYQVDKTTYIGADELCEDVLLGRDMSIEKSAVSTLANSNNTSAVADKLKNNVKNLSSDSTEDELKSTLKDFESYFVEQVIKEMKDSMTLKSDDEDSSMSQYKDMFMDTVIEQMSDTIVEKSGENITQQLYEQMKRNYNI